MRFTYDQNLVADLMQRLLDMYYCEGLSEMSVRGILEDAPGCFQTIKALKELTGDADTEMDIQIDGSQISDFVNIMNKVDELLGCADSVEEYMKTLVNDGLLEIANVYKHIHKFNCFPDYIYDITDDNINALNSTIINIDDTNRIIVVIRKMLLKLFNVMAVENHVYSRITSIKQSDSHYAFNPHGFPVDFSTSSGIIDKVSIVAARKQEIQTSNQGIYHISSTPTKKIYVKPLSSLGVDILNLYSFGGSFAEVRAINQLYWESFAELVKAIIANFDFCFGNLARLKKCKNCGKIILEIKKDKKLFCSNSCRSLYNKLHSNRDARRCRDRQNAWIRNYYNKNANDAIQKDYNRVTHIQQVSCNECKEYKNGGQCDKLLSLNKAWLDKITR